MPARDPTNHSNRVEPYIIEFVSYRNERFANRDQRKAKPDPLYDKTAGGKKMRMFSPKDFHYDEEDKVCICPTGEFLYQNGSQVVIQGREAVKSAGAKRVCGPCRLRDQCLRHPQRTPVRQVVFLHRQDPQARVPHRQDET